MAYATKADIVDLYGLDELDKVAPREGDTDDLDDDAVLKALMRASGEIDGYLGGRYTVPLTQVSQQIVQICVDIAMYRMPLSLSLQTAEHRLRYEDAIKFLTAVATEKISLNMPELESNPSAAGARKVTMGLLLRN